ncbi:MAG: hypothetical protein ACRD8O_08220, partial [Bryobacteraceae bacterium]
MINPTGAGRLIVATILIGIVTGIGAIGFHFLADRLGEVVVEFIDLQTAATKLPWVVIVPTVALGLIGVVLQLYSESRAGGVREVLESLDRHAGVIPIRRITNVILSGL